MCKRRKEMSENVRTKHAVSATLHLGGRAATRFFGVASSPGRAGWRTAPGRDGDRESGGEGDGSVCHLVSRLWLAEIFVLKTRFWE